MKYTVLDAHRPQRSKSAEPRREKDQHSFPPLSESRIPSKYFHKAKQPPSIYTEMFLSVPGPSNHLVRPTKQTYPDTEAMQEHGANSTLEKGI